MRRVAGLVPEAAQWDDVVVLVTLILGAVGIVIAMITKD